MQMQRNERDRLLMLPDADLEKLCRLDCFRGSGRGGQKRNTTDSSVRVTHNATGIAATSSDTRSQTANRTLALRRLRAEIALKCRAPGPPPVGDLARPGRKDQRYPLWTACVLDCLETNEFRVGDAARQLGSSTARLVKDLAQDPKLWQAVNDRRRDAGLPALRTS